jgi:hypothetical protein
MAFCGEITGIRRVPQQIWEGMEDGMEAVCRESIMNYTRIAETRDKLSQIKIQNKEAFSMLGQILGYGIIAATQISFALEGWIHPTRKEFEPRTAWSFYNAITESLKSSTPNTMFERHITLHDYMTLKIQDRSV